MSLKDWKKIPKKDEWYHKKENLQVDIYFMNFESFQTKWSVNLRYISNNRIKHYWLFKTKPQALKFAKDYMRSH